MIGIDKGTTYTKDDRGNIIRSTVREYRENELLLNEDKNIVEFEGKKYIVGEKGNYSTDLMKAKHENTLILILTLIALNHAEDYISTNLVTGVPIGLYSLQKADMKALFKSGELYRISVNGKRKQIKFNNVEVFPEGAGAFYSQSIYNDGLVIDIGGLSIDIALFQKKKLVKYSTYSMGIMKLYSKIANHINSLYDLSLSEWDIENIIVDGLFVYGERKELNIHYLVKEHIQEIIERLKLEYDLKIINNVLLTGGGSYWISEYFRKEIPQVKLMENAQFSNSVGYRNIGKAIFR